MLKNNKDKEKNKKPQKWTKEQENLLAEWSEKASGYRWLHAKAEKNYRVMNYSFTIPVIILSTLTGTANFAMDSFVPESHKQIAMACVGGVNIFAGILSTLQNFLRYAELMEGHRLALVSWSKFGREIAVELALEPEMRKPAFDFLTICRAEFDRLVEQSPSIDDDIIKKFKKVFKKVDIHVPEICNGLHKVKIYEPSKEEKVANILTKASEKIATKSKSWGNLNVTKINNINNDSHVKWNKETERKDLDVLHNLGKVSQFKSKIGSIDNNIKKPEIELKEIIINNKNLIENNDIENNENNNNEIETNEIETNDIETNDIETNDIENNINDTIIPIRDNLHKSIINKIQINEKNDIENNDIEKNDIEKNLKDNLNEPINEEIINDEIINDEIINDNNKNTQTINNENDNEEQNNEVVSFLEKIE